MKAQKVVLFTVILFSVIACGTNSPKEELKVLNGGDYEITIKQKTQSGNFNPIDIKGDTVILCQSLSEIARYCANPYYPSYDVQSLYSNTLYRADRKEEDNLYYVTVIPKNSNTPINYDEVLTELMNNGYVAADTTLETCMRLVVVDAAKYADQYESSSGSIINLYVLLRDYCHVPLVADEEINLEYPIRQDFYDWKDLPIEEFNNRLNSQYGLVLKEQEHSRVQVITFRGK